MSIVGTLIVRALGLAGLTGVLASALTPLPNIIIERMGGVERLERSDESSCSPAAGSIPGLVFAHWLEASRERPRD